MDPSEKLDSEVEDVLVDIGEDFIESVSYYFDLETKFLVM